MQTQDKLSALQLYFANDCDLIPLKKWDAVSSSTDKHIQLGKSPRDNNWRERKYSREDIEKAVKEGYNIGWRLKATDLVLDVDPKNGGDESLDHIQRRFGIVFEEIALTVVTGSGGRHFYFAKDKLSKTREILEDEDGEPYKGIEFKTYGRQVVVAGSRHPNGSYYEFGGRLDANRDYLRSDIFELIIRPDKRQGNASAGKLNPDALAKALSFLNPADYKNHDAWLQLMMSCHHATDGEGSEEFIQWSTGDADYAGHNNNIRMRWDSLHTDRSLSVTYKTLYKELKKVDAPLKDVDVLGAFDDVSDFDITELDSYVKSDDEVKEQMDRVTNKGDALMLASMLENDCSDEQLKDALRACLMVGDVERHKALALISKRTGMTKVVIAGIMKELSEKQLQDVGEYAAKEVLKTHYNSGKHLVKVTGSDFWHYDGTYWKPHSQDIIRGRIIKTVDDVREKMNLPLQTTSVAAQVEYLLQGICATDKDILRLTLEPLPVINCVNGELWIDENGGFELLPHRYNSYLINKLNVEYEPTAQCPLWDATIKEIFSESDEPDELVRHFEEMMGYVLQPYKDIACWWLLKGQGANGKSLLCDILSELLGESALACSIKQLDGEKNSHSMASLPGKLMVYDDDLDAVTTLPDGVLKKLSERKKLEANPKNKAPFSFVSVATPILLANKFPSIRDISNGTRRRAQLIPFNRTFSAEEMDLKLAMKLKNNELPGVLNRALDGLKRVRSRGGFDTPKQCEMLASMWMANSNALAGFFQECVIVTKNEKDVVPLKEIYDAFRVFCVSNGITFIPSKYNVSENLQNFGVELGPKSKNIVRYKGLKLRQDDDIDDL